MARGAGLDIAYTTDGDPTGEPLLLLMGLGCQLVMWDPRLIAALVERGYYVIRTDHREIGASGRVAGPTFDVRRALGRRMLGLHVEAPYQLADMARDAVAVLDALGVARAHVLGLSMGGMIAQHLAFGWPTRVRSLTSVMSTPGNRRYLPRLAALRALLAAPATDATSFENAVVRTFGIIGSRRLVRDDTMLRELARASWARGTNPAGVARHLLAIFADGDRLDRLRAVRCPTLVVHGSDDPLVPLAAGRATARAIAGAWWLPIAGMGHDLPAAAWPVLLDSLDALARSASSGGAGGA